MSDPRNLEVGQASAAAHGSAMQVNYPWDPEEPACVCCGEGITLREGCEWADDPALNLCHQCALGMISDLIKYKTCAAKLYVFAGAYRSHPLRNPEDKLDAALREYERLASLNEKLSD